MRRTGRVIVILCIIMGCMTGLWMFQSWRENSVTKKTKEIHNVYVTGIQNKVVKGIWQNKECQWQMISEITDQTLSGVADLVFLDDQIVKIRRKPETIEGKILRIADRTLQIENYGDIAVGEDFQLYHVSDTGAVTQGDWKELTVGVLNVRYVVADGKICAALMGDTKIADIRVLLKDSEYEGYDFDAVTVSSTTDYTLTVGNETKQCKVSEKQTWKAGQIAEHIVLDTGGKGKIRIENLKRQYGVPEYRGRIEIYPVDKSLHIINELSIEEYLYSVVPSEMPTEYEPEALKAQAVCARSYAVEQMKGKRLAKWGAHVDDSVSFQVYNNLREDEKSIAAVNATKNQVVAYEGKVAATYFYSVSCGVSAGIKDVWFAQKDAGYLPSVLQNNTRKAVDFRREEVFRAFLKKKSDSYDAKSPWYRWRTTISEEALQESIRKGAKRRYQVNPTQIQTKQKDGTYKSSGETDIGALKKISITERGNSGVAVMAEIVGSKNTLRIYTEYNIRLLLMGEKTVFKRQDKKEVTGLTCLPSGFFVIEKKKDKYHFSGGGFGHGVGMSQNGANALAAQGKGYQEILTSYFSGTTIESKEAL